MIAVLRKLLHINGVISLNSNKKCLSNNYPFRWILIVTGIAFMFLTFGDLILQAKTLEDVSLNCNLNIPGWQAVIKCVFISRHMSGVVSILEDMKDITLSANHMSLAKKMFYIRASMTIFSVTHYFLNAVVLTNTGYPFKAWLPYDNQANLTTYWLTIFMLTFFMYFICFLSIGIENFICINLIYMAEELQMVQRQMSKIGKDIYEKGGVSDAAIKSDLIKCVQKQQKIHEKANTLHPLISVMTLMHFIGLTTSVAMCAVLLVDALNQSNSNKSANYAIFILTLGGLGSMNYYLSDHVTTQCSDLSTTIYNTDWAAWPMHLRKSIIFIMARAQKPIRFSVGGFFDFSLRTYLQMITNCYSLFTLVYNSI